MIYIYSGADNDTYKSNIGIIQKSLYQHLPRGASSRLGDGELTPCNGPCKAPFWKVQVLEYLLLIRVNVVDGS